MDQWVELVTSHQKGSWFSSQLEQSPSVRRLDLDFDAVGWLPTAPRERGWMKGISFITICDFMWWRFILIKTSSTGSEWTIPPAPTGSTTTETFYQACSQSEEFLSNQRSENTCLSISQLCRSFKSSLLWLYWTTSPWNLWSVLCPIMFLLVFCYCSLSFCRGSHFP